MHRCIGYHRADKQTVSYKATNVDASGRNASRNIPMRVATPAVARSQLLKIDK